MANAQPAPDILGIAAKEGESIASIRSLEHVDADGIAVQVP